MRNRIKYSDSFVASRYRYSYNGADQRKTAQDLLGIYGPPAMNKAYLYDLQGKRMCILYRPDPVVLYRPDPVVDRPDPVVDTCTCGRF
jgi:hypothetical protein